MLRPLLLPSLLLLFACKDDTEDSASVPDVVSSATPEVASAVLDGAHPGWAQADCAACHQAAHDQAG